MNDIAAPATPVTANSSVSKPYDATAKQKSGDKVSRIPIKVIQGETLKKPDWIRVRAGSPNTRFYEIKDILRQNKLVTVCEEASCPNIGECFGKGTATFMIMGDKCTRRCPFCDVGHGRPDPLDQDEPHKLGATIAALKLSYVVITSVDRDDLRDGGAGHFVACIQEVRKQSPLTKIEVLVPDFRGRDDRALEILKAAPPDVMNHNMETVPRLYKEARPGSDYAFSLNLLKKFKAFFPHIPTKSGLMVGLGTTFLYVGTCIQTHLRCLSNVPKTWASAMQLLAPWSGPATTPTSRRTLQAFDAAYPVCPIVARSGRGCVQSVG
jgi:lipoyl synthase